MQELTDLEICKRIAEIDGVINTMVAYPNQDKSFLGLIDTHDFSGTPPQLIGEYNPLTDDALCFELMVLNEINVNFIECPAGTGKAYYATGHNKLNRNTICTDYTDSPNRAICLAIIEANEENNQNKTC